MNRNQDKLRVLLSAEEIRSRVAELGKEITNHYSGEELLVVGVLQGSVPFMADLIRRIDLPLQTDFVRASSYGNGTVSSGQLDTLWKPVTPLSGRHILLVEDIIDTGLTAKQLLEYMETENPASTAIASLLVKNEKHELDRRVDFCGFEIGDEFVVGYGLDYAGYYRNLDYIAVLSEEFL